MDRLEFLKRTHCLAEPLTSRRVQAIRNERLPNMRAGWNFVLCLEREAGADCGVLLSGKGNQQREIDYTLYYTFLHNFEV